MRHASGAELWRPHAAPFLGRDRAGRGARAACPPQTCICGREAARRAQMERKVAGWKQKVRDATCLNYTASRSNLKFPWLICHNFLLARAFGSGTATNSVNRTSWSWQGDWQSRRRRWRRAGGTVAAVAVIAAVLRREGPSVGGGGGGGMGDHSAVAGVFGRGWAVNGSCKCVGDAGRGWTGGLGVCCCRGCRWAPALGEAAMMPLKVEVGPRKRQEASMVRGGFGRPWLCWW